MATAQEYPTQLHDETLPTKETNGTSAYDHAGGAQARKLRNNGTIAGGNPLAHWRTHEDNHLAAFGGDFQPGLYAAPNRKFGNPAPLGLSAFALTTFVLSLINVGTLDIGSANIVVAIAYGYGGLVQLLAGMWEMAIGNTFGATALSSYGGFWISFAIILTPGGTQIESGLIKAGGGENTLFYNSMGLYLFGWFIFTFLLLICTFRSTVAFCALFVTLDLCFLTLALSYLYTVDGAPNGPLTKAGGYFGLAAAFFAWYNALAGIADNSNSFFVIPVAHFPWSEKGRERRTKSDSNSSITGDGSHLA